MSDLDRFKLIVALCVFSAATCLAADPRWQHLSSTNSALPKPGPSTQQTGALVVDFDKDGTNDFILSFRQRAPALAGYRRTATSWDRYVIEIEYLTLEAGGASYDIDG